MTHSRGTKLLLSWKESGRLGRSGIRTRHWRLSIPLLRWRAVNAVFQSADCLLFIYGGGTAGRGRAGCGAIMRRGGARPRTAACRGPGRCGTWRTAGRRCGRWSSSPAAAPGPPATPAPGTPPHPTPHPLPKPRDGQHKTFADPQGVTSIKAKKTGKHNPRNIKGKKTRASRNGDKVGGYNKISIRCSKLKKGVW